ncbi:MAG: hypothetical protein A2Z88_03510 [Omnitrophica WOR_2 bacterium GWA2_47_8]|nr:MAG: hypothetical protein A2Z88_03510 [Omnitrophica WOR_2 bacterium GWA2_47_8]
MFLIALKKQPKSLVFPYAFSFHPDRTSGRIKPQGHKKRPLPLFRDMDLSVLFLFLRLRKNKKSRRVLKTCGTSSSFTIYL